MRSRGPSVPVRILCAMAALLCGYVAIQIAVTGEMRRNKTVVELSPLMRTLPVGVLGLLAVLAGWVAATGRE
jgi:hypothetical protein